MIWPHAFPGSLSRGAVSLTPFVPDDGPAVFAAIDDPRDWEHIPRPRPATAHESTVGILTRMSTAARYTFTVRWHGVVVGVTSVTRLGDVPDAGGSNAVESDAVEIGGTQLAPSVWGAGVNDVVKALLIDACFDAGASWVQLRAEERSLRSISAIRKLGAVEIETREDGLVRSDGTRRRTTTFRLPRPQVVNVMHLLPVPDPGPDDLTLLAAG